MALSFVTVCGTLAGAFARKRVDGVLEAMIATGMVKRGAGVPFSPHNAAIAAISCALPEESAPRALAAAMKMRDWAATAPAPGRQLTPGQPITGLSDVRLARVLVAEIMSRAPSTWQLSPVAVVGHGLCFQPYATETPRVAGESQIVPARLIEEFAQHHEPLEDQRRMAQLTLSRIARSLRPLLVEEAAA